MPQVFTSKADVVTKDVEHSRHSSAGPDDDDRADVVSCLKGEQNAFARLVERHQDDVGKLLWRFTRDRIQWEGLVQDAFVEAYHSLPRFRGNGPFRSWLATIATRVGYAFWKTQARQRQQGVTQIACWDALADITEAEQLDPSEAGELVHTMLARLPPRDRLVLTLMYLEDCSVNEIADHTGWSRTMVKVQAHRARKKLRRLIESQTHADTSFETLGNLRLGHE